VYCPEQGAPFRLKERVFLGLEEFISAPERDGFCRQNNTLRARLGGAEYFLAPEIERNRATLCGAGFHLDLQWEPLEVCGARLTDSEEIEFDTALLWRMKTVWESIFNTDAPNMVNPEPPAVLASRRGDE